MSAVEILLSDVFERYMRSHFCYYCYKTIHCHFSLANQLYPDITTYLDTIQVDLSGVEIISPMTKTSLTEFMDSGVGDVNYTQYLEEVSKIGFQSRNSVSKIVAGP